jgi:hypothetical protein
MDKSNLVDEIEITPEMVRAGTAPLVCYDRDRDSPSELVRAIFLEMLEAMASQQGPEFKPGM